MICYFFYFNKKKVYSDRELPSIMKQNNTFNQDYESFVIYPPVQRSPNSKAQKSLMCYIANDQELLADARCGTPYFDPRYALPMVFCTLPAEVQGMCGMWTCAKHQNHNAWPDKKFSPLARDLQSFLPSSGTRKSQCPPYPKFAPRNDDKIILPKIDDKVKFVFEQYLILVDEMETFKTDMKKEKKTMKKEKKEAKKRAKKNAKRRAKKKEAREETDDESTSEDEDEWIDNYNLYKQKRTATVNRYKSMKSRISRLEETMLMLPELQKPMKQVEARFCRASDETHDKWQVRVLREVISQIAKPM